MYRAVFASLVLLVLSGMFSRVEAKLVPYRKLTLDQRVALEASERRLDMYDHALQTLDHERRHGKISRKEYGYEARDLNAYIMAEARFQNDILIDDQPFPPENVREVMENVAKYTILVPAYIVAMVVGGSGGFHYTSH
jgi:hypothetical protein